MSAPAEFSVRIVSVDSYMSKPVAGLDTSLSERSKAPWQKVPVIRIFGATPAGQTVCMHVHRVFPYIYVPYDGTGPVDAYLRQFAESLDHALNALTNSDRAATVEPKMAGGSNNWNSAPQQHVFKIAIVKGIPFYGFYEHEVLYLKIYFYNPQSIKRAMKLLVDGVVLRKSFQPYGAHIPYILQFFMDYNLQGMNFINASAVQFRIRNHSGESEREKFGEEAPPSGSLPPSQFGISTTYHSPSSRIFTPAKTTEMTNGIPGTTTSELEVDVVSENIMNREEIEIKIGTNPGLEAIWRDENQRRALRGLSPLLSLPASQERKEYEPSKSHRFFSRKLQAKLQEAKDLPEVSIGSDETKRDTTVDAESGNQDSLLVGVSTNWLDDGHDVNSSFQLNLHNRTLAALEAGHQSVAPSVVDEGGLRQLQHETSSQKELAEVLHDLANLADKDMLDLENEEDLWELLRQDDLETAEMNQPVDLLPDNNPIDCSSNPQPGTDLVPDAIGPSQDFNSFSMPPVLSPVNMFELDWEVEEPMREELSVRTQESVLFSPSQRSAGSWPELVRSESRLITPAIPFPTRAEMESSGAIHGLFGHVNTTTTYSNIRELVLEELQGKGQEIPRRKLASLPMERLLEFESACSKRQTAPLFKSAIRFVAGQETVGKIKGEIRRRPNQRRIIEQLPFDYRVRWIGKICNQKAQDTCNQWNVTLTPAIPFPNFSHVTRMRQRLAAGQAIEDATSVNSEGVSRVIGPGSSLVFQEEEQRLTKLKWSVDGLGSSGKKARRNEQFENLLGPDLGTPCRPPDAETNSKKGNRGPAILHGSENLLLLSMELHADVMDGQSADPRCHPVRFLAYSLMTDTGEGLADGRLAAICLDEDCIGDSRAKELQRENIRFLGWFCRRQAAKNLTVTFVPSEADLFHLFIARIRSLDPDMLAGYEIQLSSWGYLIERGTILGIDMLRLLSRLLEPSTQPWKKRMPQAVAAWEARKMSEIHIVGRIVLNLWRLMRSEVTLNIYSFENAVFNVLKMRFYLFSGATLSQWFSLPVGAINRWRAFEYFLLKASLNVSLLTKLDIIRQTSEFSRLFGIQFYDTLTRGSQFRVESMMLRLAKPVCLVPVSPTSQQLMQMVAPECLPLIIEPESRFYQDPVIVLDFQSLYPSMIIAYNYCFSTCLGRVDLLGSDNYFKFGCTAMKVPRAYLAKNLENVNISPNGVVFVQSQVRRGILPKMLEEILNTRIMVKKCMAEYKDNALLKKLLHARQLGLKLIANVTYGYTSASFSGRMPCVEIGDSIVSKARETLELAIKHVQANPKWNARVIYGDTDSMFVLLRGRSKQEAFRIGREMEQAITDMNPKPVKLKFEKVYMPCVLQTKKRYCGFMYETEDQMEPVFDAKGIETVRRDTCQLVSKTLQQMIRLLFAPKCDIVSVKLFIQKTFSDVLTGDVAMQDFIFAKEYRGRESYKPGAKVPALEIAKRATTTDLRAEPRIGQRLPYIIVYGNPREILITLIRQPWEIFSDASLRPHGFYYCTRQLVPVLNRILLLIGLDAAKWFLQVRDRLLLNGPRSQMLDSSSDLMYFRRFCAEVVSASRDTDVIGDGQDARQSADHQTTAFISRFTQLERKLYEIRQICKACMGTNGLVLECVSFDCPVLYRLYHTADRLSRLTALPGLTSPEIAIAQPSTSRAGLSSSPLKVRSRNA